MLERDVGILMGKAQYILTVWVLGLCLPGLAFAEEAPPVSTLETYHYQSESAHFSQRTWSFETGFLGRREGKNDGFGSYLQAGAQLEMPFTSWMKIEAAPYIIQYSSRVQQQFDDDTYEGRFGLDYGHITLLPLEGLVVKAGAISQKHLDNKQMISSFRSFPGALIEYRYGATEWSTGVRGQYVIPTSSSLNTERQDREALPTFGTQALFLDYNSPFFLISAQAGRYAWSDLPAKVAIDSTRAGNLPANESLDPEVRFRHQFAGWFGGINGLYSFDNGYGLGVSFKRFHNEEAESRYADSQYISIYGSKLFANHEFELEVGNYFSEADATVAKYASSGFGNTNRRGNFVSAQLDFKRYKFLVKAEYALIDEINQVSWQADMTSFKVTVESYEFQF